MTQTPPRVAFVLPGLGRVRRGAEAALTRIARGLRDRHGFEVELFGSGDEFPDGLTGHRVRCVGRAAFERFPSLPALRTECQYEEATFALGLTACRAFDARRFDAAVTCSYPYVNWLLQRDRWRGVRHLFVTQNGDWPCRRENAEYRYFHADAVAAISPSHRETAAANFPTRLIPNGVDAERFVPRTRRGATAPHLLMVGALADSKRPLLAVEAAAAIPDAWLTVVGDGPLRDALRDALANRMPDRSTWTPSAPPREVARYFRAADAFLHCSRDEPFGLVFLESMASGCPIVAFDGPTQRWVVGPAGILVDSDEPADFAAAAARATSAASAPRLSEAGRRRVTEWSWDRQVDRYAELLGTMIGPKRLAAEAV